MADSANNFIQVAYFKSPLVSLFWALMKKNYACATGVIAR